MLRIGLYIVAILTGTLWSTFGLAELTTRTFGDWEVETGWDNGKVIFSAESDSIHADGRHTSGGWRIWCRNPPNDNRDWMLTMSSVLGSPEPSLTFTFDDNRKLIVGNTLDGITFSDMPKMLEVMMNSRTMSYQWKGRTIKVSMMGVTAVLKNYLDMCPATNALEIKESLGL